jgi:hypothetical protein
LVRKAPEEGLGGILRKLPRAMFLEWKSMVPLGRIISLPAASRARFLQPECERTKSAANEQFLQHLAAFSVKIVIAGNSHGFTF